MTVIERIRQFQENQGISNYALEKELGFSNGYLHKCKNPSAEFLDSLLRKYTKLSAEWLIRGIGSMMCDSSTDTDDSFYHPSQKRTTSEPEAKEERRTSEDLLARENELLRQQVQFLKEQVDFYKNRK